VGAGLNNLEALLKPIGEAAPTGLLQIVQEVRLNG